MICKCCGDEAESHTVQPMENFPQYCQCGWHRSHRDHLPLCSGCQVHICEAWTAIAEAEVAQPP